MEPACPKQTAHAQSALGIRFEMSKVRVCQDTVHKMTGHYSEV